MYNNESLKLEATNGTYCTPGKTTQFRIKRHGNSFALIDGMNIALIRKDREKGKLENIIRVYDILRDSYDNVEIFVDASIRYRIIEVNELERLIESDIIFMCPAGITADELIRERAISLCSDKGVVTIVTNDLFPTKIGNPTCLNLKNTTVSILPSDDIYLIDRDLKRYENHARKPKSDPISRSHSETTIGV
jgi:hypothetical protein